MLQLTLDAAQGQDRRSDRCVVVRRVFRLYASCLFGVALLVALLLARVVHMVHGCALDERFGLLVRGLWRSC